MIAYKEKSLDSLIVQHQVNKALKRKFISKEEHDGVIKAHPADLYRPNIFIRIGLFIVTVIIVLMSFGLFMLMTGDAFSFDTGGLIICLFFALVIYVMLEWIIQSKRHYRSGVDDALLWTSLGFIIGAISAFTNITSLQLSVLIMMISIYAAVRFANSVMTAVMFCSFIAVVFNSIAPLGAIAKSILPFVLMALSVIIYWQVIRNKHHVFVRHYRYCFKMLEFLSLITIYASVNYFVVRELSIQMFGLHLPQGASITGGWFFWLTTLLIPPLYIFRGLQKKDNLILRTGMLLAVATVFTIRYYYSIMPVEQVMTAGGMLLIIAAYLVIKYLNTPKFGITDKEHAFEPSLDSLQVEALVITETFQQVPAPRDDAFRFGGGSSGGGGATGEY